MSKKKEKGIQQEIEEELARLSSSEKNGNTNNNSNSTSSSGITTSPIKDFFGELLRQQAQQNEQLLKSMNDTSQSMVAAVKAAVTSNSNPAPVLDGNLYAPPEAPNPAVDLMDESESEGENDFRGWDFAPSGHVSQREEISGTTEAQGTSTGSAKHVDLDDELFQAYNQLPNWTPAPEILVWLKAICDKEVPTTVTK